MEDGKGETVPSSFFSTRSTAPEQPPQDMLTLKTYLCSAPASGAVSTTPGVASTTSAIVSGVGVTVVMEVVA